ncbi:PAS domain S-box protein [Dissulfurirhabdus thermomarina]|uniref:PAS domain S-box protein n=1 Tax=Dissulfurirhabdus thermomarina TaxID=1765737 RepID=A0A6N9TQ69_DISTH|nr:sigma 54-interacting transcriptional regulator [Dissulfurirhabdus thermomarina]NDY42253.1 PAS domain S-box protein [Dissulfurirhabdus thermomarina]NMX22984.1 sigma 54-interacting transcriptional regulator [Dissulfurirhabdus thermomarina]
MPADARATAVELERYWKTVVDTIQEGVMIVDTRGTIVSVNKAFEALTGYGAGEIVGRPCTTLNCNSCEVVRERDPCGCHWCLLFRRGELSRQRCVLMRRDGTYLHVLKNASILRDARGEVLGAVETMTDITELIEKESRIEAFRRQLRSQEAFHGIVGASAPMQRVFDMMTNAARSEAPVLILGESGTGKELVARGIHELGPRRRRPYVKVNCAALNEALLESELFGHVKGAFTGAWQTRKGRFEAAAGGDIFLDEIGDLPPSTQVKLLRVLEEKVIERVGDNRPIHVDVRIISATHRDLAAMVRRGEFREDLYYRINVIPVHVPPLRERPGDIPLLAETFFRRIQLKSDGRLEGIGGAAMELLMRYPWPGNVRELKSAFEYAAVTARGPFLQPEDFPPDIVRWGRGRGAAAAGPADRRALERRELVEALRRAGGSRTRAARLLGVSRVTVWNRMKRYGVSDADL